MPALPLFNRMLAVKVSKWPSWGTEIWRRGDGGEKSSHMVSLRNTLLVNVTSRQKKACFQDILLLDPSLGFYRLGKWGAAFGVNPKPLYSEQTEYSVFRKKQLLPSDQRCHGNGHTSVLSSEMLWIFGSNTAAHSDAPH